jgi:hypothetical protein
MNNASLALLEFFNLLRRDIAQTMRCSAKGLFLFNDSLQPTEVLAQGIQQQSIRPRMP